MTGRSVGAWRVCTHPTVCSEFLLTFVYFPENHIFQGSVSSIFYSAPSAMRRHLLALSPMGAGKLYPGCRQDIIQVRFAWRLNKSAPKTVRTNCPHKSVECSHANLGTMRRWKHLGDWKAQPWKNWSAGKAPWGAGKLKLGKSGALERHPGALES